jgi:hypothetical protein
MRDPREGTKRAVFTRWQNSDSIRTDRYHYTEWRNQKGTVTARMLYDHRVDPGEVNNVADDPEYSLVVSELSVNLANHIDNSTTH